MGSSHSKYQVPPLPANQTEMNSTQLLHHSCPKCTHLTANQDTHPLAAELGNPTSQLGGSPGCGRGIPGTQVANHSTAQLSTGLGQLLAGDLQGHLQAEAGDSVGHQLWGGERGSRGVSEGRSCPSQGHGGRGSSPPCQPQHRACQVSPARCSWKLATIPCRQARKDSGTSNSSGPSLPASARFFCGTRVPEGRRRGGKEQDKKPSGEGTEIPLCRGSLPLSHPRPCYTNARANGQRYPLPAPL